MNRSDIDLLVETYNEQGWVKVESLVPRDYALGLAEVAWAMKEPSAPAAGTFLSQKMLVPVDMPSRSEAAFSDLCTQPWLGDLMARLIGCDRVRFFRDRILIKPAGDNRSTPMHQDLPRWPLDRRGPATVWLALADLPCDSGTLRYVGGSHRWGPLGRHAGNPDDDVFDEYPSLKREPTPPQSLRAGDALVHDSLVVHGADANATGQPRIAYTITYMPANTRYSGLPFWITDDLGLQVDQPFEHELFPLLDRT